MSDFAGDFGGTFLKMVWKDDGLELNLRNGPKLIKEKTEAVLQRYAPEIENWMKVNAPWTDQTGAARNGLAARYYSDSESTGIILFHQVPYGLWLEVRYSGKYAIIDPALQEWGPRVMAGLTGTLEEI